MSFRHCCVYRSEGILTSPYSATQGSSARDLLILNHDQVTRSTPELATPSLNFHNLPKVGRLSPERFNVHRLLKRCVFSSTRMELMMCQPRVRSLDR
ncbi:hypothetical protein TNCV_4170561 [Trichonephila clavipes]|nr:hypothetical protein TNCV_4170561 [Trichonephila clavipes]